jgi:3'-phosphoadenosine 5'-phosphosulfate sulfotransferase (PAPS reductase)/FAD synthetase
MVYSIGKDSGAMLHIARKAVQPEALSVSASPRRHRLDPRCQRPELWSLYNTKINRGENMRVFPLSNWTELDVGEYTRAEPTPVVPDIAEVTR